MNILLASVFASVLFLSNPVVVPEVEASTEIPVEAPKMLQVEIKQTLQDKVRLAFLDQPRMNLIVKCESKFRQFKNGKPLMSPTSDVGVMQINQVHWKEAKKLGLDIFNSEDDNIKMGRIIYEKQGINGWSCNKLV